MSRDLPHSGAFIFASDLLRQLDFAFEIDFLNCTSYGAGTESSGTVELLSLLRVPVKVCARARAQ